MTDADLFDASFVRLARVRDEIRLYVGSTMVRQWRPESEDTARKLALRLRQEIPLQQRSTA